MSTALTWAALVLIAIYGVWVAFEDWIRDLHAKLRDEGLE